MKLENLWSLLAKKYHISWERMGCVSDYSKLIFSSFMNNHSFQAGSAIIAAIRNKLM